MKLLNRTSALPPGRAGGDPRAFDAKKVALLYRDDVHSFCRDTGCHDPTKFEDLLFTLPLVRALILDVLRMIWKFLQSKKVFVGYANSHCCPFSMVS